MSLYKILKNRIRKSIAKAGLVGLLAFSGSELYAKDIYVPRDYATIQSGIDASEERDRVLVAPGEYVINEPITYRGKNIILKSEEGPQKTVINGGGQTQIFTFNSGESENAVLEGFTITGGYTDYGGGIYCENSSPTIRGNIIQKNYSGDGGGGIACINASPLITSNIILKNVADENGGGIYCGNSEAIIEGNIIKENASYNCCGGGILVGGNSPVWILKNYIIDNWTYEGAGGIFSWVEIPDEWSRALIEFNIIARNRSRELGCGIVSSDKVVVTKNTIVQNSAGHASGGVFGYDGITSIVLGDNIIYGNTPQDIAGIDPSQISYNCLSQPEYCGEKGNICADPLFVNPNPDSKTLDDLLESGNYEGAISYLKECYSLQVDSPCIDAGDPNIPWDQDEADFDYCDGTRVDIGAMPYDQRRPFIRGDANRDNKFDLSDPAATLLYLFKNKKLKCLNAADSNRDHKIDIADVVYSLKYLFSGGNPPEPPFPEAGIYTRRGDYGNLGCRYE